jgi:hypothetical protein
MAHRAIVLPIAVTLARNTLCKRDVAEYRWSAARRGYRLLLTSLSRFAGVDNFPFLDPGANPRGGGQLPRRNAFLGSRVALRKGVDAVLGNASSPAYSVAHWVSLIHD